MGQEETSALVMVPFYLEVDALEFYNSLPKVDTHHMNWVLKNLEGRFCPESFNIIIRDKFCSDKQGEDEPIDNYISRCSRKGKSWA